MKYTLRAGQLSEKDSGHTLARLRGTIPGQSRQVSGEDGGLLLRTQVRLLESSGLRPCDVRLREYVMLSQGGALEVSIDHRGLAGGWDIEADDGISAAFLLGLFSFCRYMERENGSVCV